MEQETFNQSLFEFLDRATTPFHAVQEMARELQEAGFSRLAEDESWDLAEGDRRYVIRNGSSIVAFIVGRESPAAGVRMLGAHTDSPCLMVKPVPEKNRKGYLQLGVEVYGGALLNPWFDRDLSLAGRVSFECAEGDLRSALVDFRDPIASIPQTGDDKFLIIEQGINLADIKLRFGEVCRHVGDTFAGANQ